MFLLLSSALVITAKYKVQYYWTSTDVQTQVKVSYIAKEKKSLKCQPGFEMIFALFSSGSSRVA